MGDKSAFVIDADWLEKRLGTPGLSIVDASWYMPAQKRDPRAEYDSAHIPGAVFFDQDLVVDPDSTLPHTLPSPSLFARFAGSMGISADDTIVVYDRIREAGYAVSLSERRSETAAISCPVFGVRQQVVCAISLGVPLFRFDKKVFEQALPLVMEAGRQLTRDLGGDVSSFEAPYRRLEGLVLPD